MFRPWVIQIWWKKVMTWRYFKDFFQISAKKNFYLIPKFNSRQKDQKSHFGIFSPWLRGQKWVLTSGNGTFGSIFETKKEIFLNWRKTLSELLLFSFIFGKKVLRLISGALHSPYFLRLVKENLDAIGGKMSRSRPGLTFAARHVKIHYPAPYLSRDCPKKIFSPDPNCLAASLSRLLISIFESRD